VLLQVHAHGKIFLAFPREHHRADGVICGYLIYHHLELIDEVEAHAVVGRVVDGNNRYGVLALQQKSFWHDAYSILSVCIERTGLRTLMKYWIYKVHLVAGLHSICRIIKALYRWLYNSRQWRQARAVLNGQ
jgi:hypothetical protein